MTIQASVLELKSAPPQNTASQETVTSIFAALNQEGIRYCHWKSNLRLAQSLAGQTDLDLLVDRNHSQFLRQIFLKHNVKPLVSAPGKLYPGVENYLGFDPASGKQFHLHVHYQLVLGEQFVKNYRLPLETYFLDSAQLRLGVLTPAPELELIVLSIRALLKYRDRDAIKDALRVRSPGFPAAILKEIEWLLAQTSMEQVKQRLQEIGDIVPADVIVEFLHTVTTSPRDGRKFFALRARVRKALSGYQRYGRLQASFKYYQAIWRGHRFVRKLSTNQRMTPANGGLSLAIIGADGSGKSTMSQLMLKWLSWKLDVHRYYMGSKQPSWRSELIYLLFRLTRRGQRIVSRRMGEKNTLTQLMESACQISLFSHYLSIAYDRRSRYLKSRKKAAAGSIVLYDRFPLASPLDGPKIQTASQGSVGKIVRVFFEIEQKIYRTFRPPDYLIALDVSPEVSLNRKPDHDLNAIVAKSEIVRQLVLQGELGGRQFKVVRIDADQPFETVVDQLKETVWKFV